MNAVIVAVVVMLFLSLLRTNVVISLIIGAFAGGLIGGLSLGDTIKAFNTGITSGAEVALNYAFLGAFAVAISKSRIPDFLAAHTLKKLRSQNGSAAVVRSLKWLLVIGLLLVSISSQNLIPIHIAFIPLLIPPLLPVIDRLGLDRRLIACIIAFGLITPYMFLPVGFGQIFLSKILLGNMDKNGLSSEGLSVMRAMALPALGMVIGLIISFFSYRFFSSRPQLAETSAHPPAEDTADTTVRLSLWTIVVAITAIAAAFTLQIYTDSMIMGALIGFLLFSASGVVRWRESDGVFVDGMKMMAMVGFIMITAAGFAEVLRTTGQIDTLVKHSVDLIGGSKALGSFVMLVIGLLITMGIGSSFSTIPIIAVLYVPLAIHLGFSPLAIVALIGTAGALGDAGSPASDSTLGPTAGLNADGKHNHIWGTVVPTFLHYNLPLLVFGWIATMIL